MEINMDPKYKQMLDDVFDAFTMLSNGAIVSLMHVVGGFTRYSASAIELLGLPGEYIPNGAYDWNDYLHPEDRKRYMDVMTPLIEGKTHTYDITYRVRINTGDYSTFRALGAVLRDSDGNPSLIGGVLINEGLTQNIDPVTVLPNKNAYLRDLNKFISEGKQTISLDVGISKFTDITRVHGYTYSNRLLQEISWLLKEIVADRANIYRLNDATFAILSENLTREELSAIYDMIRYRLQRGIEINGIRNILIANGSMVSTNNSDSNAEAIYSCLVYAYEESKQHAHGELVDFNGSINYEESESIKLINDIRDSILNNCEGFHIEYEPVIAADTENVNGAEAKVVWENEKYGIVSEEDFLPILERDFVFEELGDYVLRQSLNDGVGFLEKDKNYLLCINVYSSQLETDYFIDNLLYYIEESGFPANQLSLKFSSDCRLIEPEHMRATIDKLHKHNILVILDGFGSGTDSIAFLKRTHVDAVCLDKQFTNGIESEVRDRVILEHLTKMASTCVEHINIKGVESKELRDILRQFPVTTMQGEYYSAPLTFDEMVEKYYS
ncbi:MAG: EAL domain-containing protein [Lachnospiraceae bacterium]|nr:EAL domain-containing protein [Lachnospiraceae bacterium]